MKWRNLCVNRWISGAYIPEGEEVYGLANEFKTVPGVHTQSEREPEHEPEFRPQAQEEDEGVLFGDAPEQRTKKLAYN